MQCSKIDAVLIFGNIQFTTQALHELFEHGIEIALLSRSGRLKGQLTSPFTKNIELRVEQFKKYDDDSFKLNLSKSFVMGKVNNGLSVMKAFSYNHPGVNLHDETNRLGISLKEIARVEDIATLRGVEGFAARTYFSGFGKMVLGEFSFKGRNKIAKTLLDFGTRVQYSVFECIMDDKLFEKMTAKFSKIISMDDNIRIYTLCAKCDKLEPLAKV